MLEAAETAPTLSVEEYRRLEPELRTQLVQMQLAMRNAKFSVIVVVSGDDPAGTRDLINLLSEWMDPRFVATTVFSDPTPDEMAHPPAWRYWRQLPPHGKIAVFSDEWLTHGLALRLGGRFRTREFSAAIDACRRFERMLAANGTVFLKLYVHRPVDQLEKDKKRIRTESAWSDVAKIGKALLKRPRKARAMIEEVLEQTSGAGTMWNLLDGSCKRHRNVTAVRMLLEAVGARLAEPVVPTAAPVPMAPVVPAKSVLDGVDLSLSLTAEQYDQRMSELQRELRKLTTRAHEKGISVIAGFEGWDAAGKGGTIRRLAYTMNPENYRIVPIAAPTDEEKAHQYLWRFWRHVPAAGGFVIFDRTWYGRVLVERVEGFATSQEWGRAYEEINYFEQSLASNGIIMLKFWLHIDRDEQLRRFKDRESTSYKQYKIGPDDYRNREKWDQYVAAIDEMVARTSTPHAPWHLIPSNDKKCARVDVLARVAQSLRERL